MSKLSRAVGLSDNTIYNQIVANMQDGSQLTGYRAGRDFQPYGQIFTSNPEIFNEYVNNIAIKYGVIIQRTAQAQNPLSMFRRGQMPYGGKLEAIVYDTIVPSLYKGVQNSNPFEVNFGRVAGETFVETQDVTATNTVVDTQDTMYFQNLTQFHDFVLNKALALLNGVVLDEYLLTKLTLSKSIADGVMTTTTAHGLEDLAKQIKSNVKKMQYFSRDFNAQGFNQASLVSNLVAIVPVDRSVDLDVKYYSQLFNPENSRVHVDVVEVDSIPDVWEYTEDHQVTSADIDGNYLKGTYQIGETIPAGTLAVPGAPEATKVFDGTKVGAIILDRDALQIWDQLPTTLSTISNPKGRYTNLFVNKKSFLMFVGGLNSLAIFYDENTDTNQTMEATIETKVVGSTKSAPTITGAVGEEIVVPAGEADGEKTITVKFNGKTVRTPGTTKVTLTNGENLFVYTYSE